MKRRGLVSAWQSAVAPASVLLALALAGVLGKGRPVATETTAQAVAVSEIVPHEVEVGDRIAILGKGFPSGKVARVTFRGTLHRPGERPVQGAEIGALAAAVTADRLELAFDEATQALFCGAGERAIHTTFEGDVEVAFPAVAAGAAPVAGLLKRVTVDVRPGSGASPAEREREGGKLLAWMGAQAGAAPSGLVVENVRTGSRAEAAGFRTGDVLTGFDGVRVASIADLLPPPGARSVSVAVRIGRLTDGRERRTDEAGTAEVTRTIPIDGFRRSPPAGRLAAALLIVSMLTIVWLVGAPTPAALAAGLQRVVSPLRERRAGSGRGFVRALLTASRDALPRDIPAAIADAGACALIATMPFAQYVVAARLDVGLLFAGGVTSLVAAALLTHRSPWDATLAAGRVAWQHLPAAVAVASVVLTTGSLRIQEIEGMQGGSPWDWLAFRSPPALVAFGLLFACARIEPSRVPAPSALARLLADQFSPPAAGPPWSGAACHGHRVIVAGLASALFLGGWRLPGLSSAEQDAGPLFELAGVAVFLAKTRLLVVAMVVVRWILPPWRMGSGRQVTSIRLLAVALAAFAATAAWNGWGPAPAEQLLFSLSLMAAVVLAGFALGHRLRHALVSPSADGHLSPFL
jgi:NADH-quinone oxidoreductase subunit H